MCGITGIFSSEKVHSLEARIKKMNESIVHRGPDADGYKLFDDKCALGHKRLSIIDVDEAANQPMELSTKRWHIVFNGEIYNYKEIKKELSYTFETNGDTEVILAAVEEYGIDWFLQRANGMFSMALYDSQENNLLIIRDRMGIKPLYYFYDGNQFIFGSEIKAILSSGLVDAIFNETGIDEYLANRYVRAPYTFFKEIYQVESGTYIKLDATLNRVTTKYWQLPLEFCVKESYNEEEILKRFQKEVEKSIKYRLIADVPLGTYLSGGVDSSLITAVTSLIKKEQINTYTIGFPELNEFEYSRSIAEKYDTIHHELLLKKENYLLNWERLIAYKDAPLGVPNEIPLAIMSSRLKEDITVVLSGEGADELMGGYGKIFRSPFTYKNKENDGCTFYDYLIKEYEYVPREMRDSLLNTSIQYRHQFDEKIQQEFKGKSNEENVFRFFHQYHVKGLLQRVDMTTMQASVEARVPFLDHNLIEFSYKEIPYELKLKWKNKAAQEQAKTLPANKFSEILDTPKYLLREMAYDYLPKNIVERLKVGFPVPLNEWFGDLEMMANSLLKDASWLKGEALEALIVESRRQIRAGQILWMFVNVEVFRRQYFCKNWRY